LTELHHAHAAQSSKLKLGSKKKFFHRVWNRLHGSPTQTADEEEEAADSRISSSNEITVGFSQSNMHYPQEQAPVYSSHNNSGHSMNYPSYNSLSALEEIDDWLKQVIPFQQQKQMEAGHESSSSPQPPEQAAPRNYFRA